MALTMATATATAAPSAGALQRRGTRQRRQWRAPAHEWRGGTTLSALVWRQDVCFCVDLKPPTNEG